MDTNSTARSIIILLFADNGMTVDSDSDRLLLPMVTVNVVVMGGLLLRFSWFLRKNIDLLNCGQCLYDVCIG